MLFAEKILETPGVLQNLIDKFIEGRKYLIDELDANGYAHKGEAGNFIFIKTKTDAEKKELAKKRAVLKHYFDGTKGVSTAKKWSIPLRDKLIITIRNHPKFRKIKKNKKGEIVTNYKTTFSHVCGQSEIKNVLKMFDVYDKQTKSKVNLVEKYYWNGKEYAPDVLPAWGW
jgi:hypothetical protein